MKITAAVIAKRKEEVMQKELKAEASECFTRKKRIDFKKSALYNYYQTKSGWIIKNKY
jgi:hypothetical protein